MISKGLIYKCAAIFIFFIMGSAFAYLWQPAEKSDRIYQSALKDFSDGQYQNSYYLFSKISFLSDLKPYAIYHQSQCAKELGDKKSEIKQYQLLYNNYRKNKLSIRSRYLTAIMLMDENPELAKHHFNYIIEKYPNTDYSIASEYFIGMIDLKHFRSQNIFPNSEKNNIENCFRHYLKRAPQGRLALNAANNWLTIDKEISSDDYLLMAQTYYLFDDYKKVKELLTKIDLNYGWVLDVKNSYALKNYTRVKALAEYGLKNYTKYAETADINDVVDIYISISDSKKSAIDYLFEISAPRGKDYIWSLKCDSAPSKYQMSCYKQLYLNYPESKYGANALSNIFFGIIKSGDYKNAEKVGKDYLNKFKDEPAAPMVMFWLGKIAQANEKYEEYTSYYKGILTKYPDNYYAYRAYIALKHLNSTLLNASIKPKPVQYPYKGLSKNDIILRLVKLGDYDVLDLITEDDFIKSWLYYQKGDYSHSMLVARDAMEKISPKPDKYDLRWRLVYPVDYFEEIKKYSNTPELMLALMREESYFNPKATSSVGARGLMQLMPATASEIYGSKLLPDDLYKPELNIKIGNAYYSKLRSSLNNLDISAIAAYNGGIGSIKRWQTSIIYNDTDEFVEQIPYAETKNYVKKVFRSYWNYLRIYTLDE